MMGTLRFVHPTEQPGIQKTEVENLTLKSS